MALLVHVKPGAAYCSLAADYHELMEWLIRSTKHLTGFIHSLWPTVDAWVGHNELFIMIVIHQLVIIVINMIGFINVSVLHSLG